MNNKKNYTLINQMSLQYNNDKLNSLYKTDSCFVHEWMNIEDKLYGFGVDDTGTQVYINPNVKFSLYCMVREKSYLTLFNEFSYIRKIEMVEMNNNIKPTTTIFDTLVVNEEYKWMMYKLYIDNFDDTQKLYRYLSNSDNYAITNYIKVPCVWTLEVFIILEMMSCNESKQNCYFVWINDKLEIVKNKKQPPLPTIIAFDIETVSPDSKRVPIGNIHSDILFSASIVICTEQERILHSLVYIPVDFDEKSCTWESEIKNKIIKLSKPNDYQHITKHEILFFNSEIKLVEKCLQLFDRPEFYIAIGFNSKTYDMPFLMRRCAYLSLPQSKYFYINNDILTYKYNMLHLDLILLYGKYYNELGKYFSLNKIAKVCLKESKVDVNAVNIRFMFEEMLKINVLDLNKVYKHEVTLDSCIYYNDVDTLLLLKLWYNIGYHTSIQDICRSHDLSLVRISQSEVNEYISVRVFKQALSFNMFLTHNHNNIIIYNDILIDYHKIVKVNNLDAKKKSKRETFMGGFNYRAPKTLHSNINTMDYVAYYPYMINGFNLSYETVSVIPLSVFGKLTNYTHSSLNKNRKQISFEHVKFYRFVNHRGDNDFEVIYQAREFINKTRDHGGILTYNQVIKLLQTTSYEESEKILLLLIYTKEKSLLSNMIEHQNKLRDMVKLKTKELNQLVENVQNMIAVKSCDDIENNNTEEDEVVPDNDDGDDDDDFGDLELPDNDEEDLDLEIEIGNDEQEEDEVINMSGSNDIEVDVDDDMKLIEYKIDTTKDLNDVSLIELQEYYEKLIAESTRIESIYRTLKIVNSSMYGVLGASYGSLIGLHVAAAVTFLGRYHILEASHHGLEHNYETVFIDTDSVFLCQQPCITLTNKSNDDHEAVPKYMKSINENLVLTTKSYPNISIFVKKRYIVQMENGETFNKSITKNGPALWQIIIDNLSQKYLFSNRTMYNNINNIFDDLFKFTYDYMETHGKGCLLIKQNSKEINEYASDTPMKKLLSYIELKYPEYTKTSKSMAYFHYIEDGVDLTNICFRPDFELESTHPKHFNLFKFYGSISKSIFDILNVSVSSYLNTRGIYNILNHDDLFKLFMFSFIKIRNQRFALKNSYLQ